MEGCEIDCYYNNDKVNVSKYITENDLVWNYSVYTSIESWGDQAEYIRDGLDFEKFWYKNNYVGKFSFFYYQIIHLIDQSLHHQAPVHP